MSAVWSVENAGEPQAGRRDDRRREPPTVPLASACYGQRIGHGIGARQRRALLARCVMAGGDQTYAAGKQCQPFLVFAGIEVAATGKDRPVARRPRVTEMRGAVVGNVLRANCTYGHQQGRERYAESAIHRIRLELEMGGGTSTMRPRPSEGALRR